MNNRGFTLLELLMSITMLALITGIISGALSMAHRTLEKGEKKIGSLENVKSSFSLIEYQIQSIFPAQYDDQGEKKLLFSGQKEKMKFSTNYSLWRGTRGNTIVNYEIQTDNAGKQSIKVIEQVRGMETKNEINLLEKSDKIYFEYFLKNQLEEGRWVEQWPEDEKNVPEKIKMYFISGKKKETLIVNIPAKNTAIFSTINNQPVVSK